MKLHLLFWLLCFFGISNAQTYNMPNGMITTCSGTFYDSGGAAGNYAVNEVRTVTFCPGTAGSFIQLDFSMFDLEGYPSDYMTIYNGPNTSAPLMYTFGTESPLDCDGGRITSTAASGCLTIRFISDGSLQYAGWQAAISCVTGSTTTDNSICEGADAFCADAGTLQFPNSNGGDCVHSAPGIITTNTCLVTAPFPAWYYVEVGVAGDINLQISQTSLPNGAGNLLDVDYAIWGPFTGTATMCNSFNLGICSGDHNCSGNVVDCSWSDANVENATIPNAQLGQRYLVLITNFSEEAGYISMTQTNAGTAGAGSTDCSIVCPAFASTSPTSCGGTNGSIAISHLDPNTTYTVSYLDDGAPISTTVTSNAAGNATITGLNAGNYTNLTTNFAGCSTALANVTLVAASAPVLNTLTVAAASVCSGGNAVFNLSGTANASVAYTINGGGIQNTLLNAGGTGSITIVGVAANTTITLSQISLSGCSTTLVNTATVTVTTQATANISYTGPFCTSQTAAQTVTLTGTNSTGGNFTSAAALSINGTTGAISPSTSTSGTYIVTYTIPASGTCAAVTATANVTITAPATANLSYAGPFCTSQTSLQNPTLTGTGTFTGGTYTSTTGLSINASTGAVNPSASTAGTYVVTYTIAASGICAAVTATANVTITAPATANISYAGPFCTSQTSGQNPTLTGTGTFTGGTYTSTSGLSINTTTGAITPSASVPGTYVITYTIPASGTCAAVTATANVTITAPATASLNYAGPFCTSQTSAQTPTLTGSGTFTGGTYTSTGGLSINATTGAVNPSASAAGIYVVTYTIAASGSCLAVSATATVTIAAPATANLSYAGPFCTSQTSAQTPMLTGTGTFTGGTYTSTIGLSINTATGAITPSASAAGAYVVTYTIAASGSCAAVSAFANVTITAPASANLSYAGPFCTSQTSGQNPTLTGTGTFTGGTYASTGGLSIHATTGAVNPSASAAGTYVVTYTIAASGSCAAVTATANVTITAPATVSLSYAGTFCTSQTSAQNPTLTGTGTFTGGTYTSTTGLSLNATTGAITPSASAAGAYVVTYTIAASGTCAAVSALANVTITAPATASLSYAGPFCTSQTSAQTPMLTGTGTFTGGTYTSTIGLSIHTTTGAVNPSASAAGAYVVTYTIAASGTCAAVTAFANVTVTAPATAILSYAGPFCTSQTSAQNPTLTSTGTFTGGTYASTGGLSINTTTGAVNPSASAAGAYVVTYTIAASGTCAAVSATANVVITAPATANLSYAGPFCTSQTSAQNPTLTGTGTFTGGTYASTTGLSINPTTGAINPSASVPGTYVITYTIPASGSCAAVTAFANVTIMAPATANLSYAGPFCTSQTSAQNPTLTGTGTFTGGTYTSTTGLSINTTTGAVNPSASAAGAYVVTYTIAASGSCAAVSAFANVTITAPATANLSYAGPFCSSQTSAQTPTLTGTGTFTGGTYASTTGLSINLTTGAVNPSASTAGTYVVTYTIATSGICAAVTATANVTITAPATANLSYAGPFCTSQTSAQNPTLTGTGTFTGGTYASTTGLSIHATTGAITPSASAAGAYVITYTIPASGSCAAVTATANVTVTAPASASLSYAGPFCTSQTSVQTPTLTGTGTFTGGTYTSTGGLSINATTGAVNPSASAAGTYVVTYTIAASGTCAAFTATANLVITAPATASLSYAGPFCTSQTSGQNPTLTGTGTFTGGTYASTTGLSIHASTGAINPAASAAGIYVVTYTIAASGTCAAVTAFANVTITAPATASLSYAGPFCTSQTSAQNPTLTGTGTFTGGTYTSTTGLSLNATTGAITPSASAAGIYVVTYTIPASGSCAAVSAFANVTITAPATASLSYAGPFCTSQTSAQNPNLTGTGTFTGGTYASTGGLSINTTTGAITPSASITGTYVVTYTIAASGSCAAVSAFANVTITAPATASLSYAGPFCTSQTSLQNPTLAGTGTFTGGTYTSTSGLSIHATTGAITPSASAASAYVITYTIPASGSCAAVSATANVTINATPIAIAHTAALDICDGDSAQIALSSLVSGTSFTWTVVQQNVSGASAGSGNLISAVLHPVGTTFGKVIYTIVPATASCTGAAVTVTIRVHPLPVASLQGGKICRNPTTGIVMRTLTLNAGLDDAQYDFEWFQDGVLIPGATHSTYVADDSGVFSVIATNSVTGCTAVEVSAVVTETEIAETILISGLSAFAENPVVTIQVLGSGQYAYQLDNGSWQSSNSFNVTNIGTHTIRVTDADDCTDIEQTFTLIGYPKFFTPNEDSYNDRWNIWSLANQQSAKIFIFDRYGKLLKSMATAGEGWDGSYNGQPMPATDYWFVVEYDESGARKELKAHFSLKR